MHTRVRYCPSNFLQCSVHYFGLENCLTYLVIMFSRQPQTEIFQFTTSLEIYCPSESVSCRFCCFPEVMLKHFYNLFEFSFTCNWPKGYFVGHYLDASDVFVHIEVNGIGTCPTGPYAKQ